MFKITNNSQVYLSKGETATYIRSVRVNDKYATPYRLPLGVHSPKIKLSIKNNKNDKIDIITYEGDIKARRMTFNTISQVNSLPDEDIDIDTLYILLPDNTCHYYFQDNWYTVSNDCVPTFSSQIVRNITDFPTENIENVLYRMYDNSTKKYKYYFYNSLRANGGDPLDGWQSYNFVVRINISSSDTQNLRPATYYYDLMLITRDSQGEIEYKDVWLNPTEFVIGGSF